MSFLFFLSNWKWIAGGLAILLIGGWIVLLKFQLHFAEKSRMLAEAESMQWQQTADQYLKANIESQAAFEQYKIEAQQWADIARKSLEEQSRQARITNQLRKDILNAPESDNKNVGPILNFTLDCLRQFQTGAVACRH